MRQVRELLEALGDVVQLCRLRERVAESSAHQRMGTEGVHKIVILGVTVERRAVHCAVGPGRPRSRSLTKCTGPKTRDGSHQPASTYANEHRGEQDADPDQPPRQHLPEIHPDEHHEPERDLHPGDPAIVGKEPRNDQGQRQQHPPQLPGPGSVEQWDEQHDDRAGEQQGVPVAGRILHFSHDALAVRECRGQGEANPDRHGCLDAGGGHDQLACDPVVARTAQTRHRRGRLRPAAAGTPVPGSWPSGCRRRGASREDVKAMVSPAMTIPQITGAASWWLSVVSRTRPAEDAIALGPSAGTPAGETRR